MQSKIIIDGLEEILGNDSDLTLIPHFIDQISPCPQKIEIKSRFFKISSISTLSWIGSDKIPVFFEEFFEELRFYNQAIPSIKKMENNLSSIKSLNNLNHEEAYTLKISQDGIIIEGNSEKGIFYGIQTIYQIFSPFEKDSHKFILPEVDIIDYPDMGIRAISDEMSRGQSATVANVKKFIKILSRFKLNTYQFYWEDIYQSETYPMIGRKRGGWTNAEIKEVEDYASAHCVDLYPILNSLGHMETYFWNPELKELGEFPGSQCINVANPKAYEFLKKLFTEIGTAFSSPSFHIGADESRHVGYYGSKDLVEKEGLGNVYLKHYKFCIDTLVKLGKKRIFLYSDIAAKYKEVLEGLPRENAIFVMWDYGIKDRYERLEPILKYKIPFVVSSSALNWARIFPEIKNSIDCNYHLIGLGLKHGALGEINSSWGDNGNESFRENRLHSFAASSSMAWHYSTFDRDSFNQRFFLELFGTYDEKILQMWQNLNEIYQQMQSPGDSDPFSLFYPHLWRHPFARYLHGEEDLDLAGIQYREDYKEDVKPFLKETLSLIKKIRPTITRYSINLDYFEYAIEAIILFINKIQGTKKIETMQLKKSLDIKEYEQIIIPLREEFRRLRGKYEKLWLACAKFPRLDKILRYFDWMIFWYDEKLAQINAGILYKSPMLLGDWISHKDDPNKTDSPRFFKKMILLTEEDLTEIDKICVQMIPGSYGVLWINGQKIGCAPEALSTTALPMDLRELIASISPEIFHVGENIIEIMVQVWPAGWPVVNFLMHIGYLDKPAKLICTDLTWRSSPSREGPWLKVVSRGKSPSFMKEVYMPNFEKGWHSQYILDQFGAIIMSIAANPSPITSWFVKTWEYTHLFL